VAPGNDKHPNLLALGRAVKLMREQRDMSVDELAEASAVRRERLDALETGQLDPTYELLVEIADSLGACHPCGTARYPHRSASGRVGRRGGSTASLGSAP
jgi:DNA-binding XRE family transcriptional regulator